MFNDHIIRWDSHLEPPYDGIERDEPFEIDGSEYIEEESPEYPWFLEEEDEQIKKKKKKEPKEETL